MILLVSFPPISFLLYLVDPVFTRLSPGKLELTPILDKFEAVFDYITNDGRKVVIQTDLNAPMFKLITVDLDDLSRVSSF